MLDLAFVSDTIKPEISIEDGISDHNMTLLTFYDPTSQAGYKNNPYIDIKLYRRADDASIIDNFETAFKDFSVLPSYHVNGLWTIFQGAIKHCEEYFIPTTRKQTNRKTPWITEYHSLEKKVAKDAQEKTESVSQCTIVCC